MGISAISRELRRAFAPLRLEECADVVEGVRLFDGLVRAKAFDASEAQGESRIVASTALHGVESDLDDAQRLHEDDLVGQEGEYLGPLDSVKEVCRDLKFHHDAMMGGMAKAFGDFIDRFDPDELRDSFDKTLDRKPLFDALNKLKYWQLYCDLYPIITQQATASLPQQFSEDFVREYEKSIAEFKRLERVPVKSCDASCVKLRRTSTRT